MMFLPESSSGDSGGSAGNNFTPIWRYRMNKVKEIVDAVSPRSYGQHIWSTCAFGHMCRDDYFKGLDCRLMPLGASFRIDGRLAPTINGILADDKAGGQLLGIGPDLYSFLITSYKYDEKETEHEEAKLRIRLIIGLKNIHGDDNEAARQELNFMIKAGVRLRQIVYVTERKALHKSWSSKAFATA